MTKTEIVNSILRKKGIDAAAGVILAGHCTFRIGGPAELFVRPKDAAGLCEAVSVCVANGCPYYLLGNGSNTLFSDEGFAGAVIDLTGLNGIEITDEGILKAECGASLAAICLAAKDSALTGLEFAYGIPGTVGGAVYMNAGAYGGEIKDVLLSATVMEKDGSVHEIPANQLDLSYRHSAIEDTGACILSAEFTLKKGDPNQISARMEELMGKRRDKQPLDKPSAGSTFKRPDGAFAAALIDQCGLRGCRIGGAAVSEKHCGFVINAGGATCADVEKLCEYITGVVYEKTGYRLEKEIRIVG